MPKDTADVSHPVTSQTILPTRRLGMGSAMFMVCANMIGTGVFTSLGYQVGLPFSPFDLLLLWAIGGALALCGALAYGELALRMPRSGGECRFLDEIYGPFAGFLAGWISIVAGFAASLAACAFALASYAGPLIALALGEAHGSASLEGEIAAAAGGAIHYPQLALATAAFAILLLAWIQRSRVEHAMRFQNFFVFLKLGLVIAFLAAAFRMSTQAISFAPTASVWSSITNPGFAVCLVFVSFSYSGWNAAVYIADDVRDPQRTLPRALFFGTLFVALLYVLLNAAFLATTSREAIAGRPDVAFVAAQQLWGARGAAFVAAMISLGLVSSVSSLIWAGGSVAETLGERRPGFRWLAKRNRHGRPARAVALIAALALIMLATSSFGSVIKLIGVLLACCASLSVAGVFILDRRAARAGGRRSPLYVKAAAAVFLMADSWILFFLVSKEPASAAAAAATLASGALVYWAPTLAKAVRSRRRGSAPLRHEPAMAALES